MKRVPFTKQQVIQSPDAEYVAAQKLYINDPHVKLV